MSVVLPSSFLHFFSDALPIMTYYADKDLIYRFANSSYEHMIGCTALPGKYVGDVLPEAAFNSVKHSIGQALRGETVELEIHTTLNKTIRQLKARYTPYKNENGTVEGYLATIEDITNAIQINNELEEKRLQLEDYVENAAIGLHWLSEDGTIIWANKTEMDMLGYTESEFIGHNITEFHVDQSCPAYLISRLMKKETLHNCPAKMRCKDGSIRTVHINSSGLWDGDRFVHSRCFMIDVTEQERLFRALQESEAKLITLTSSLEQEVEERTHDLVVKNEQLRQNEERYHLMVDEVEDYAILLLDKKGNIQNWNKGAEKIKGYAEDEIIGKNFRIFYLPDDQDSNLPESLINHALHTGKVTHEGWRVRKDGSRFWGYTVLTALHGSDNSIIGFSKVTRDLTDRKAAEDELIKIANELQLQNKELQQFAYVASHDMKEPLRKIIFYNNYLLEEESGKFSEKGRDFLGRSINAAQRMRQLIDDLLNYSQTSSVKQKFEAVNLNEIVDSVLNAHSDYLEQNPAEINVDTLPVIEGIPFQLFQLFDNMISNSIKYRHPDRALKINIKSAISRSKNGSRSYYRISIQDNGIGFEKGQSEHIFELFSRLVNRSDYAGSGIGLAICKKIVQNHNGIIKAKGTEQVGATFDIYFPRPGHAEEAH